MRYRLLRDQKSHLIILDVILLLLGLVGYLQLTKKADLPYDIESTGSVLIIHPSSQSVNSKIPDQSILKAISGNPEYSKEDIEFDCDGHSAGNTLNVVYEKDNALAVAPATLVHFYSVTYLINAALVGLFFYLVALFVLLKRPYKELSAVTFHNTMMAVFVMITTTWGNYTFPSLFLGILTRILFSAAYAFFPVFFVRFSFVYPRTKWQDWKKLDKIMIIISSLLAAGMAWSFYRAASENSPQWFDVYKTWFDPTRFYFAISCMFTLVNFLHSYKYSLEESERRKMRWILLGTSAAVFTFVFLWQLPQLFTSKSIIQEDFLLIVMAVIPLTYGFSILRYHAFDIDLIFKRSTVYGFVFLFMIAVYAMIIGGFTVIVGKLTVVNSIFLSGVASIVSAALIQPLSNTVRKYVDRKFFVVQYSYHEAQRKISEKIETTINIEDMIRQVIQEIDRIIPMEKIFFIKLTQDSKSGFILTTSNKQDVNELESDLVYGLNELSGSVPIPFVLENCIEKGIPFSNGAESLLKKPGLAAIFPVFSKKTGVVGYLMLGRKKSDFVFSVEDVSLITFACLEVAGTIEKIELRNKLMIEKELSELKSFFVSSVSHDLKTPLTSIKMFSEIIRTGSYSMEKRNEYLGIIEGESDRLTRLINNVLDFSSIEKGVKEYYFDTIDLNTIVQDTAGIMHYQFQINSFSVNECYSPDLLMIKADRDAVIEVVMNLLSNAIKYSDEQKTIDISTQIIGSEAVLEVRDSGIGIPEESLFHLFEPFLRIKSDTGFHAAGTGLGLTIVKNIMDAHNGRVEVKSKINQGSTFSLYFPLVNVISHSERND